MFCECPCQSMVPGVFADVCSRVSGVQFLMGTFASISDLFVGIYAMN